MGVLRLVILHPYPIFGEVVLDNNKYKSQAVCLSVCPSVRPSVSPSVCLFAKINSHI